MNVFQKAVRWFLWKAAGFPTWTGGTTDIPPGGWGAWDGSNSTALQLAVVYGCGRVRGQTLGSVPFNIFREAKSGRRDKATDHPLYPILHDTPNTLQTSMDLRECLELSFCLYGNAYAEIMTLGKRVTALNFIPPAYIRPQWDVTRNEYNYRFTDPHSGKAEIYPLEKILHIKNFTLDGIHGLSPIRKHVIEHAYEAQNYGLQFFKNLAMPKVVLKSDSAPPNNEETTKKIKADWQEAFGGTNNNKMGILWKGLDIKTLSLPPEDAQYIATRQLSTAEIAGAIYGVPLNLLGQPDKSATYASAEQFDIQFVKHTIRPQCVRYEQAFNKRLFANEPNVFCEFDLDALQRGDSQSQAEYFAKLVANGIMSRDEVRRKLNLPERGNGADDLTVQSNMLDLNQLAKIDQAATGGNVSNVTETIRV